MTTAARTISAATRNPLSFPDIPDKVLITTHVITSLSLEAITCYVREGQRVIGRDKENEVVAGRPLKFKTADKTSNSHRHDCLNPGNYPPTFTEPHHAIKSVVSNRGFRKRQVRLDQVRLYSLREHSAAVQASVYHAVVMREAGKHSCGPVFMRSFSG